ncbi:undecaprenyl/decaprenyl-phosphate alpha-N-acetylglucosaminyl 1-phosphate transferase [Aliifodinibius sp. S!AR15-10]|uniref:glycosyltransferase family 4 protein n=1 Tax=Aliifodinibius sp. S!AR15-10 TaxID=2950437 RepID=UPI0028596F92|nr:MraY family glycosyltransferase [Aliifodinibius sp. S!AR15-10]MDR8393370.1 undecaprenyl/decaprenyl-phosphate alpha-N-acetylglucosaminyl 1-phosphate transferase [Aliifodinibius sp. S!AR15-10]
MDFNLTAESVIPIAACIGAFIIAYYVIPVIINVSHLKHLFDDPTDSRKLHTDATPNLGGIAIFSGLTTAFLLSSYATAGWVPYVLAGLVILFFSGIKDDIMVISPRKKLALQILAIAAPIVGAGVMITDLGGVFGQQAIPGWAGIALTFFTMVVVVNAYNLIDGIDGLAGGVGVIVSLFFGSWFWSEGLMPEAVLAFTLTGSILAFLWFNFEPASIFMGDTGSQVIGYVLAFLAVRFVDFGVSTETAVLFKNEVPVLILAVLIVPLYDTLRVFLLRASKGRSPFSPDRLHVHHQLIDAGFSHRSICYIIYSLNLCVIGLTILMAGTNVNLILATILGFSVVLFPTTGLKRNILEAMGFKMPSARHINILERKYGFTQKTIGREMIVTNDDIEETTDVDSEYDYEEQDHEYGEVAKM